MSRTYAALKERQRRERHLHAPGLALRVHRALSWYGRAEQETDDLDARFVFLWISFNAAYATDINAAYRSGAQGAFVDFLDVLLDLDREARLADMVWKQFTGSIRGMLENKFLFRDFWDSRNGTLDPDAWERRFIEERIRARRALAANETLTVLNIVLDRIYTLRNQVVHGGATWDSGVNRDQLRDCARFMGELVPVIIEIMMDNPQTIWGGAVYPVVKD
jgi:hypothetical protein